MVPLSAELLPLLSTFAIVALAEFGDKTQIAVISLSAKHRPQAVFAGALLAFALVDGVSALVGGAVAPFVPPFWIGLLAGISFLVFGLYTLLSKEDAIVTIKERSNIVSTSFFLISIMELGDKTQLAVIALSAEYDSPVQVFIGVMIAFTLLTALGVIFGKILCRYVEARYTKIGTGLIFLLFGFLFLSETFSGMKLF
jgi:putative Ca2+/H+ antiporter (TMEM165/GDT1 family)